MRRLLGRYQGEYPIVGDKLVCLRNNHDKGLLNGTIWLANDDAILSGDKIYTTIVPETEPTAIPMEVDAHACHFEGRSEDLAWWDRKNAEEFDYGYAFSVHKA